MSGKKVPALMEMLTSHHMMILITTKIILPLDLSIHLMKMNNSFRRGNDHRTVRMYTLTNMALAQKANISVHQVLKWNISDHRVPKWNILYRQVRTWKDLDHRRLVVVLVVCLL